MESIIWGENPNLCKYLQHFFFGFFFRLQSHFTSSELQLWAALARKREQSSAFARRLVLLRGQLTRNIPPTSWSSSSSGLGPSATGEKKGADAIVNGRQVREVPRRPLAQEGSAKGAILAS